MRTLYPADIAANATNSAIGGAQATDLANQWRRPHVLNANQSQRSRGKPSYNPPRGADRFDDQAQRCRYDNPSLGWVGRIVLPVTAGHRNGGVESIAKWRPRARIFFWNASDLAHTLLKSIQQVEPRAYRIGNTQRCPRTEFKSKCCLDCSATASTNDPSSSAGRRWEGDSSSQSVSCAP